MSVSFQQILGGGLAMILMLGACEQAHQGGQHREQPEWTPHEQKLLGFIERYKTHDAGKAHAAMSEELDYLKQPLDNNLSPEDLAYLRALTRIRLGLISHHLGRTEVAAALFEQGAKEFNIWAEAHDDETRDQTKVIEAVIACDQGFSAPWHEPWRSRVAQVEQP